MLMRGEKLFRNVEGAGKGAPASPSPLGSIFVPCLLRSNKTVRSSLGREARSERPLFHDHQRAACPPRKGLMIFGDYQPFPPKSVPPRRLFMNAGDNGAHTSVSDESLFGTSHSG